MNRLRALLSVIPGPEAKEEPSGEGGHHNAPFTVAGAEIEVDSHIDELYQPKGVPFPQRPESPVALDILRDSLVVLLSCDRAPVDSILVKQSLFQCTCLH